MKDPMLSYAKELKDMKLLDFNKWPGYFMRKFNLSYKGAVEAADAYAKMVEIGPYTPPKRVRQRYNHDTDYAE